MNSTTGHANGGGQLAVATSSNQRGEVRGRPVHGSLNGSRSGKQFDGIMQELTIAFPLTASYGKQVDSSDTRSCPPSLLHSHMAVRRLTPRECERLQGFPDDYKLVEYRGKLAADDPSYRALWNSMAVPVMRWIGERIAAVDQILREIGAQRTS